MKPLWMVKGYEKQTSWNVSVLNFVFSREMSRKSDVDVRVHLFENVDVHVEHEIDKRGRRERTQNTTHATHSHHHHHHMIT